MAKNQRKFVPRMLLAAACAARVVPACAVDGCGGKSTESGAGGAFSVGVQAFGGNTKCSTPS